MWTINSCASLPLPAQSSIAFAPRSAGNGRPANDCWAESVCWNRARSTGRFGLCNTFGRSPRSGRRRRARLRSETADELRASARRRLRQIQAMHRRCEGSSLRQRCRVLREHRQNISDFVDPHEKLTDRRQGEIARLGFGRRRPLSSREHRWVFLEMTAQSPNMKRRPERRFPRKISRDGAEPMCGSGVDSR